MKKVAIIISANSDIAYQMCLKLVKDGWVVIGTYRKHDENAKNLINLGMSMHQLDISNINQISDFVSGLSGKRWDFLLNAPAIQSPVGNFTDVDFDEWSNSIHVNFIEQLRITHKLLPYRNKDSTVLFFAGGGTNNAVLSYSAYTISKIASIKVCELLDAEIEDAKFAIIGPGWVKTKIHDETINAGERLAGKNYQTTLDHFEQDNFTSMHDVIGSIEWVLKQPKEVVGGRNFSTVYDAWGDEKLVRLLQNNTNMYKLRRNGNDIMARGATRNKES